MSGEAMEKKYIVPAKKQPWQHTEGSAADLLGSERARPVTFCFLWYLEGIGGPNTHQRCVAHLPLATFSNGWLADTETKWIHSTRIWISLVFDKPPDW